MFWTLQVPEGLKGRAVDPEINKSQKEVKSLGSGGCDDENDLGFLNTTLRLGTTLYIYTVYISDQ